jgi:hypothetical protein
VLLSIIFYPNLMIKELITESGLEGVNSPYLKILRQKLETNSVKPVQLVLRPVQPHCTSVGTC